MFMAMPAMRLVIVLVGTAISNRMALNHVTYSIFSERGCIIFLVRRTHRVERDGERRMRLELERHRDATGVGEEEWHALILERCTADLEIW